MTPHDVNAYLTWLIAAIMGRLQEADGIASQHGASIYRVAAALQKSNRQPLRRLYRGILLEPHEIKVGGVVDPQMGVQSVSFTEDRDVACYFGLPDTIMSGFVKQQRPLVEGYLAEHMPQRSEILWHYRWNPITVKNRSIDVRTAARSHPLVADPFQFDFVFDTQKEVIVKPLIAPLSVTPIADTCPDPRELDRRFTPPHIYGAFSP